MGQHTGLEGRPGAFKPQVEDASTTGSWERENELHEQGKQLVWQGAVKAEQPLIRENMERRDDQCLLMQWARHRPSWSSDLNEEHRLALSALLGTANASSTKTIKPPYYYFLQRWSEGWIVHRLIAGKFDTMLQLDTIVRSLKGVRMKVWKVDSLGCKYIYIYIYI